MDRNGEVESNTRNVEATPTDKLEVNGNGLVTFKIPDTVVVDEAIASVDLVNLENGVKLNRPFSPAIILRAATLVRDAQSHRFLNYLSDETSMRLYNLYYRPVFKWLQYLAIFIILGLAIIEEPSIWPNAVPFWGSCIIEIVCICYLAFRIVHLASFQERSQFIGDRKNIAAAVFLVVFVIDIVVYSLWRSFTLDNSGTGSHSAIRWSRPLRPLLIINFPQARQIRRAFRNIRRTLLDVVFVLILFLCSMLLFALLGSKLFIKRNFKDRFGLSYLDSYQNILWELYVLVTTSNNPDIMMPAYDQNNWYALFFIIFLVINLYVFMNILLASIVNSYKKNLKNEVMAAVFSKRRKLADAFDLVKVKEGDCSFLTYETWTFIMKILAPERSPLQAQMIFQVMDEDGDGKIHLAEFLTSADLLSIPLTEVKDRLILWDKLCPGFFNNTFSKFIRTVVMSRWFRLFFNVAIVVNAGFIAASLQQAEWFFLGLFTVEILLKLFVYGPGVFLTKFWSIFDLVVIGGAIIATIVEALRGEHEIQGDTLDFILVLRVLRLIKLFKEIERFRIVLKTLVAIAPSILTYGSVLFIFYYVFAIIGMEIFQGKVRYFGAVTYNMSAMTPDQYFCGNKALNNSEFYMAKYCSNNFNDIAKSMVVLTELTVVNQWHVLSNGFEAVTSSAARLFFACFHVSVVVIVMNIFIAFILEAFILEYSLDKSKLESRFEARIIQLGYGLGSKKLSRPSVKDFNRQISSSSTADLASETGIKFHVKQNARKVENLLQRMFEDEIDSEDLGSLENENAGEQTKKLSLQDIKLYICKYFNCFK